MTGLAPVQVYAEVAWTIDPLVRPGDDDWTLIAGTRPVYVVEDGVRVVEDGVPVTWGTGVDPAIGGLRGLSTRRGANVRTGRIDPARATATVDNKQRELDPRNTDSPWYPNVRARRRIRFLVEVDGETARTIATGFIKRLPSPWVVGDSWVDLETEDLLDLVAEEQLPDTVLHVQTMAAGPDAYWPLNETSGRSADDIAGTHDGTYRQAVDDNGDGLLPYDPASYHTYGQVSAGATAGDRFPGQWVDVGNVGDAPTEFTVSFSVQTKLAEDGTSLNFVYPWRLATELELVTSVMFGDYGTMSIKVADGGEGTAFSEAWLITRHPSVKDGTPMRVTYTYDGDLLRAWIDGAEVFHDSDRNPSVQPDVTIIPPTGAPAYLRLGAPPNDANAYVGQVVLGQVAYYTRVLTDAEVAADAMAVTDPWAGDRTGERLERILDLLGIDDDDRNVETGTQVCGPTMLGVNARTYIEQIAATEQGPVFVGADGRIWFRGRTANNPTVVATFTGDMVADPGTPYLAITPDDGIDRLVNRAEVTLENGITHVVEDAALRASWGPKRVAIDTLHATASGARATAGRLIIRNGEPRTTITGLRIAGHDLTNVPVEDWLDLEVGDAVNVHCQPTGGEPFTILAIVESLAYRAGRSGERVLTLGVFEHIVLPCFEWGTSGQGWSEAVWCEGA